MVSKCGSFQPKQLIISRNSNIHLTNLNLSELIRNNLKPERNREEREMWEWKSETRGDERIEFESVEEEHTYLYLGV